MDDNAKRTADVLLDFYAGFAASEDEQVREAAFNTALSRFNDVGAFSITMTDEHVAQVEITPVLLATGTTTLWLVDRLAAASNKSEEEVLFDLRQFIAKL
ncbi:hypothetical protein LLS1_37380 [Leifsonia sp. LS1]|uniref:hypothetical protein n=1 Tax=Leifsonia sp. LS1 TaxID=2828483 RepID=UPI001CFCC9A6|nr:hypothetical protein [Leifsonia sp. LS1]GIT82069.1 hypothetical protein LLS1_37380 [Leifsonia sp. LS1]